MIVAFLMLLFSNQTYAQYKTGEFSAGPTIRTFGPWSEIIDAFLMVGTWNWPNGIKPAGGMSIPFLGKLETDMGRWGTYEPEYKKYNFWQKEYWKQRWEYMKAFPDRLKSLPRQLFRIGSYSFGYHIGHMPRTGFPIGFDAEVAYQGVRYTTNRPDEEYYIDLKKRMVTPIFTLRFRPNNFATAEETVFTIDVRCSYNIALHYEDDIINDKNAVNNGMVLGGGFTWINATDHYGISFGYEKNCYKFFNPDYVYDNMTPFSGCKTSGGNFYFSLTHAIGRISKNK